MIKSLKNILTKFKFPTLGFTLVELIAVVVILGIILVIAVPKITDVINNTKINAVIKNEEMLIRAVKNYLVSNNEKMPTEIGSTEEVTLEQLQTEELIQTITSPFINDNCNGYVLITKTDETNFDYTPHLNCVDPERGSAEADGLVGYWKLDNSGLDYSSNNNVGIINGVMAVENRFGTQKKSYYFSNSNHINFGQPMDLNLNPREEFSIIFWHKTAPGQIGYFLSKRENSNVGSAQYSIYINSGRLNAVVGGRGLDTPTTPRYDDNTWYHVAFINYNDNGTYRFSVYVNGEPTIGTQTSGTYTNNVDVMLGARRNSSDNTGIGYPYTGTLDDVRIYNRALTVEEINYIYNIEKSVSK